MQKIFFERVRLYFSNIYKIQIWIEKFSFSKKKYTLKKSKEIKSKHVTSFFWYTKTKKNTLIYKGGGGVSVMSLKKDLVHPYYTKKSNSDHRIQISQQDYLKKI